MAAKKVYAVRRGKVIGILDSWEACKEAVDGYPGAEYRGFKTLEEARAYMEGIPYAAEPDESDLSVGESGMSGEGADASECKTADGCGAAGKNGQPYNRETSEKKKAVAGKGNARRHADKERPKGMGDPTGGLVAYVDGSYEHSLKRYAFGCVFILPDDTVYVENGSGDNADTARQRNVSGEMLGAMFAVRWAIKNGFPRIELRYDYEGIEKWVTGAWKSKTELTQKYAAAMRRWMDSIQMRFTKVEAHTNVYYNELADRLAKDGLTERDGIPDVWLMEEMEPWAE